MVYNPFFVFVFVFIARGVAGVPALFSFSLPASPRAFRLCFRLFYLISVTSPLSWEVWPSAHLMVQ